MEEGVRDLKSAEQEVELEAKKAEIVALVEFKEATRSAWERYMAVWNPARKAWEASSKPHWERFQARIVQIQKEREEGLARLRSNWSTRPKYEEPENE